MHKHKGIVGRTYFGPIPSNPDESHAPGFNPGVAKIVSH
jgi:hypothetical protein